VRLDQENGELETAKENRGDDNLFPDKECIHVQTSSTAGAKDVPQAA
jgi:hypothetical protein